MQKGQFPSLRCQLHGVKALRAAPPLGVRNCGMRRTYHRDSPRCFPETMKKAHNDHTHCFTAVFAYKTVLMAPPHCLLALLLSKSSFSFIYTINLLSWPSPQRSERSVCHHTHRRSPSNPLSDCRLYLTPSKGNHQISQLTRQPLCSCSPLRGTGREENEPESIGTAFPGRFSLFFLAIYSADTYLITMRLVLSQAEIPASTYVYMCASCTLDTVVYIRDPAGHPIDRVAGGPKSRLSSH